MCPDTASGVIVIDALVTTCHNNNSCLEPGSIHPAMATRSFKPAYTDLREERTPPHASVPSLHDQQLDSRQSAAIFRLHQKNYDSTLRHRCPLQALSAPFTRITQPKRSEHITPITKVSALQTFYVYRQSSFVILVIIMNSLQQTLWKPVPSTRAADYVRLPLMCLIFAVAEEDGRRGQRAEYFPDEFAYRNLKRRDYPHEKEFVRVYSINALTVNVVV
ncbi:hypothetical protein B0H10DRAFT_1962967 [Mycena sp. CBHHK59/15]|nr:hypothetical protein B0H10DRAFT_1962967 [Mycena sp. CBHHK59/15]